MSNLSFMEKLLDGVDVELKALGDDDFVEVANSGRKPVKAVQCGSMGSDSIDLCFISKIAIIPACYRFSTGHFGSTSDP